MRNISNLKSVIGFLLILLLVSLTSTALAEENIDPTQLKMYDSTTTFEHFDYELNPDGSMKEADHETLVETEFETKVIENKYLKITLLPNYGGRLLSMVYKPTGKDMLYQNPVGIPYGIGDGSFYYDWLMVYGGIFPTFPESEHGKYWNTPWSYEVVENSNDQISISMSMKDDYVSDGRAEKFEYGATGITANVVYTVHANKPFVEMGVELENDKSESVDYEYWTCTTLAPGAEPGNTIGHPSMEIVAPMDNIKNMDWWPWSQDVDEPVDEENMIFEFDNIAKFENWEDMGISYGIDVDNWWGVINQKTDEGILRIGPNKSKTPGMKFWTWGHDRSYKIDPYNDKSSARPYIELWAGNSNEFFEKATLDAKSSIEWDEYYLPTVGLEGITNANENAAAHLTHEVTDNDVLVFNADLFSTQKDLDLTLELSDGEENIELATKTVNGDPESAVNLEVPVDNNELSGVYLYKLTVKDSSDNELLVAEKTIEL